MHRSSCTRLSRPTSYKNSSAILQTMRASIALLMMFWLPLQGFAAVAMPFCDHVTHRAATADAHAHHSMHHAHAGHGMQDHQLPPEGSATLDCDNCGACNLACTPVVPAHSAAHQVLA